MPLDPSIIMQSQPVQVQSPVPMMQQALMMRDLMNRSQLNQIQVAQAQRQFADQNAMRQAYANNVQVGPNGQASFNTAGYLSDLGKSAPYLVPQAQQQMMQMQNEKLQQQVGIEKQLAWSIPTGPNATPEEKQQAWGLARDRAIQFGIPGAQSLPAQHPGDQFVQNMQQTTLTADEHMKQQALNLQAAELPTKLAQGQYYGQKGVQAQTQTVQTAQDNILKDPQVLNYQTALQGIGRIKTLMNGIKSGQIKATPQVLGDFNNLYTSILTARSAAPMSQQQQAEYSTLSSELASLTQKLSKNPTDINAPKILNQIAGQIDSLDGDFRGFMKDRVDEKKIDYGNATANKAQDAAVSSLMGKYGPSGRTPRIAFGQGNGPQSQAAGMVQMIAPNGKIKMVPQNMVNAAIAAGGKLAGQGGGSVAQGGGQ